VYLSHGPTSDYIATDLGDNGRENTAGDTNHELEHWPYPHEPADLLVGLANGSKVSCAFGTWRELRLDELVIISQ